MGESHPRAYAVKSRIKGVRNIVDKVERKRKGAKPGDRKYDYEPDHVTDGCGFRIVTLFQEDQISVIRELLKMIQHKAPYTDNPIDLNQPLKEVVIYTNRPPDDPSSIHKRIEELFGRANFGYETKPPENRKSGYSSVHLIVNVPVEKRLRNDEEEIVLQPMEIQVRDIFEEAWCEVDHALRYVDEREDADEDDVFDNWKPHLNALKTFADGCAQHASIIKKTAIKALKLRQTYGEQIPAQTPNEAEQKLTDVLPRRFHSRISEAIGAWASGIEISDQETRRIVLRTAAEVFLKLTDEAKRYWKHPIGKRDVLYQLSMLYAYCLDPETEKELTEVLSIYQNMCKRFPKDALARYRTACALGKLGEPKKAEEMLRHALGLLEFDDTLPERSWVRAAVPRVLGFSLWVQSKEVPADPANRGQKLTIWEEAVDLTQQAWAAAEQLGVGHLEHRKALNNLAYYIFEFLSLNSRGVPGKINKSILRKYLEELEEIAEVADSSTVNLLHTLMRCYEFLGQTQKAVDAAFRTRPLLLAQVKGRARRSGLRFDQISEHLDVKFQGIYDDVARLTSPEQPPAEGDLEE